MRKILLLALIGVFLCGLAYADTPGYGDKHWRPPVATSASLPSVGNQVGDVRCSIDTGIVYSWSAGSSWVPSMSGYDNSTIGVNGSNQLYVKDSGISEAQLNMSNSPTLGYFLEWDGSNLTWASVGAGSFVTLTGDQSIDGIKTFTSFPILPSGTPGSAYQAASKFYVDSVASGMIVKPACRAATTGALPTCIYNNGTGGVGATLTKSTAGVLPDQDAVTLVVTNRLLVKDQAASLQNGIYVVSDVGGGSPWILTRATDYDQDAEVVRGTFTYISEGTANAGIQFGQTVAAPAVGTDPLVFTQISSPLTLTLDQVTTKGSTTTNGITVGNVQTGANGADGKVVIYSEQGGTDYEVTLNPNATMTANADFYLPAALPGGTYFMKCSSGGVMSYDSSTYLTAETDTLDTVTGRGATTTNAVTVGNFQTGANGADGKITIYSEQGGSDYTVSLNPSTAMTANADFYLPPAKPVSTYLVNCTSGGSIGYDTNTYLTAEADTLDSVTGRGATTTNAITVGNIQTGANGVDGQITIYSEQGATDYSVILKPAPAMTATTTYILPTADGGSGQVLTTNGAGVLSWTTPASGSGFGDTVGKLNATVYLAATDGIVCASCNPGTYLRGYSDGSNPPTTLIIEAYVIAGTSVEGTITFPVKKGNYWKTTGGISVKWTPSGS